MNQGKFNDQHLRIQSNDMAANPSQSPPVSFSILIGESRLLWGGF